MGGTFFYQMKPSALKNILFLDIETVATTHHFDELSETRQALWIKKSAFFREAEHQSPEELYERAGIYSEFGKIVVIAVGFFAKTGDAQEFRISSFANTVEKVLLEDFKTMIEKYFNKPEVCFCAHNGKEFDFPYIARRMVINGIALPEVLQLSGKKPWEIKHLDTLEMWKFGDYKHFTSLDLLADIFGLKSSKDDIDGSQVNAVYYEEKDLKRIDRYCQKDVAVLAQVFLKLTQLPDLESENIQWVNKEED